MRDSIKPVIRIGRTNVTISNQGYTYNESGFTYNQIGWQYGGKFGQDITPIVSLSKSVKPKMQVASIKPSLKVNRTNVVINNQGYTYNEAGFTYNELGWMYGVIFGHDIYPLIANAVLTKPRITLGRDFGAKVTPPTPTGNSGMLIGMLGLTYP